MRYQITMRGVPLGEVELPSRELATGLLEPLPAFESVRSIIREGSRALLALGFFGAARESLENAMSVETSEHAALARAADLQLELRDNLDALVPAMFVNVIEPPDDVTPVVIVRFRDVHAGVPAMKPGGTGGAGASEAPDG
jgi:hypothetical protein